MLYAGTSEYPTVLVLSQPFYGLLTWIVTIRSVRTISRKPIQCNSIHCGSTHSTAYGGSFPSLLQRQRACRIPLSFIVRCIPATKPSNCGAKRRRRKTSKRGCSPPSGSILGSSETTREVPPDGWRERYSPILMATWGARQK